jgi:hypothetical protein
MQLFFFDIKNKYIEILHIYLNHIFFFRFIFVMYTYKYKQHFNKTQILNKINHLFPNQFFQGMCVYHIKYIIKYESSNKLIVRIMSE